MAETEHKTTDYKTTLKLPKTDFPMKANLPKREPEMLKHWEEIRLYETLLAERKDATAWILHDGPPYANGRVHMGTALNKVLKDFVVRSRAMMGFRTPFVPGWDCHGMPIEFKVSRDLGEKARAMPKLELRRLCRAEAEKWIDLQRKDFMRLGCIGDWFHPYITMDPSYDAAEIGVLRHLVERGYVYRGLRPVHWCFADRTALAEAEVEYREHVSPSIYVAFAFNANLRDAAALACERLGSRGTRRRTQGRQALRGDLDHHAVDAARQPGNQPQPDLRLRRAQGGRSLLRRRCAAGRGGREGMRAHRSKKASRSIARRSNRSTGRIFSAIRLSPATSS